MDKKKVAYVITKSNWGGAQRYVFDLATSLPKDTFEVVVAFGGTGGKDAEAGRLKIELEVAGIRTIFVQSFMRDISLGKEFAAFKELKQFFKTERPDVAHLNSSKAGGVGALAARLAGVKNIIFTSHGLAYDEDRNIFARAAIYLATWVTFLLCHTVIVITQDSYNRARRMPLVARKLRLVHNGIVAPIYKTRDEARAFFSSRRDLAVSLQDKGVWIGAIAELTWNKGLHDLVRAAGALKRKGLEFQVVIIGEGGERVFLETMIKDEDLKDRVHLAGFVENAAQYLPAFDIFALPSVKEGLPYVLMEAGQAGLPVVASNVGGVSDIVGDKVSGLLVKPKNHGDLANKLEQLIKDQPLREKLGTVLKERVEKEFSLEKMITETAALY